MDDYYYLTPLEFTGYFLIPYVNNPKFLFAFYRIWTLLIAMTHFFGTDHLKRSLIQIGQKNAYRDGRTPLDKIISSDDEIYRLSTKCISGSYKFKPYSLKLFLKGRGEAPREICIPSLLDQAILKSLDLSLKEGCSITNATNLAFFTVRQVVIDISKMRLEKHFDTRVLRLDIKKYFDTINHEMLLNRIDGKSCPPWIRKTVKAAITTPAKELHKKTPPKNEVGVPQGLSIASHLADLYLESFENVLKKYSAASYRYVDDILIFYYPEQEKELLEYLKNSEKELKLEFHKEGSGKYYNGHLFSEDGFEYLGYKFIVEKKETKITIRDSSVQKFINSCVGLIHKYQKGGYHTQYPDTELAEQAFIFDLNEKITGAFQEDRRYGWLWYFRQMNDLPLLDKMDKIIKRELKKSDTTRNIKIKRLKRAHYEISNFRPNNKYILNYGLDDVALIKKYFGRLNKRIRNGTPEETLAEFIFWTNARLRRLMLDEIRAS